MRRLKALPARAWRWLKSLIDEPQEAAVLFTALAVLLGAGGYFYLHGWGSVEDLARDFYANLAGELISIGLTVLIIDRLNARRAKLEDKRRIIRQIVSPSREFALEAVRIVAEMQWLTDGSLSGADLSRASLHHANLSRANLQGANLGVADLQEANLQHADLRGADLASADLRGANLIASLLRDADLSAAQLQGAMLIGANVEGADLRGANLQHTCMQGAHLQRVDLRYADLRGADLRGADLQDADLRDADLRDALMHDYGDSLIGNEPRFARLSDPDLPSSCRQVVNLQGADLRGADLSVSELRKAKLDKSKYDVSTIWPNGFDPQSAGAINVDEELGEDK